MIKHSRNYVMQQITALNNNEELDVENEGKKDTDR